MIAIIVVCGLDKAPYGISKNKKIYLFCLLRFGGAEGEAYIDEPSGVQPIKAIVGAMPCVNLSGLDKHPHSKGAFSF